MVLIVRAGPRWVGRAGGTRGLLAPSARAHHSLQGRGCGVVGALATGELDAWHSACADIPLPAILPRGLGGDSSDVALAALHGDAVLKLAVVEHLVQDELGEREAAGGVGGRVGEGLTVEWATHVVGTAVSNEMLAEHAHALLPNVSWSLAKATDKDRSSAHDTGTLVEAAVAYVHRAGGDGAVNELARWLLARGQERAGVANAKGALFEAGGQVETERVGGQDHNPQFESTATLLGSTATAVGSSKKEAEQRAAAQVLQAGFGTWPRNSPTKTIEDVGGAGAEDLALAPGALAWMRITFIDEDSRSQKIRLHDGESYREWFGRKIVGHDAFHAVMISPKLFPQAVRSVTAWKGTVPCAAGDGATGDEADAAVGVEEASAVLICLERAGEGGGAGPPALFIGNVAEPSNKRAMRAAAEKAAWVILQWERESRGQ